MKFTIQRDELERAIARAGLSVPAKCTLPILTHLMFRADAEGLELTGTNLDETVRVRAAADVARSGGLCVPLDRLRQLVPLLPPGPVTVAEDKGSAVITAAKHRSRIPTMPADEFPTINPASNPGIAVSGALIRAIATRVAPFCSTEESRQSLLGVGSEVNAGCTTFLASDGFQLVRVAVVGEFDIPGPLPAAALQIAAKLFDSARDVELSAVRESGVVQIAQDGIRLIARSLQTPFPATATFFQFDSPASLVVSPPSFILALKRLSIVAHSKAAPMVVFEMSDKGVKATAAVNDRGRVLEEIDGEFTGKAMRIGLNPVHVLAMFSILDKAGCDSVRLSFGRNNEHHVLIDGLGSDDTFVPQYITLPLRAAALDLVEHEAASA